MRRFLPEQNYTKVMMKFIGIIPARYESSRFPGKPLAMIAGKPMIQHVFENASKTVSLNEVVVATDDERIFSCVSEFGGKVVMTSSKHPSGTDRCNEVLSLLNDQGQHFDAAINIQGDEPFLNPEQIETVIQSFKIGTEIKISTLIKKISQSSELFNSNVVKAVVDKDANAVYFSRSSIPYMRDVEQDQWINQHSYYKHIGIYGYRSEILKEICQLEKSSLEKAESLEQLRWIENGYKIKTTLTTIENQAVDTPEDLKFFTDKF